MNRRISKSGIAVGLALVVAAAGGFGIGAFVRGGVSLGYLGQIGTVLVTAIPALAAYLRTGKIQKAVDTVKEQTNGTTSALITNNSRAIMALAAIADDPHARIRAAALLRRIEAEVTGTAAESPSAPVAPVPPPPPLSP
jgi:hypothetical protein